ncbi:high choriolytic enzyme 1-like [Arapaima gigas]
MPSPSAIAVSLAVLCVAQFHLAEMISIRKVAYNVTAKHLDTKVSGNTLNDDQFSVSTLIEKANTNLGQEYDRTVIEFGDIAVPGGLQNADPCTARGCKWPKTKGNVYVPYLISRQYSARERQIIEQGLRSFSTSTCVRFKPRGTEQDYIKIESLNGCFSFVGRRGGAQTVSLSRNGCVYFQVVQHELLHALGFNHEQTRSDRDQHVRIVYENIMRTQEHNFRRINTNNLLTPYDYNSVMHYGRFAFSRNGQATIVPIPNPNVAIGRAMEMSRNDILRINRLYNCSQT